ncbi:MAG: hypothetical protein GPJ54_22180 [Candidatus Heimdallarchaeota archaeon]|nr:hypothetical protein [Candidatus Heimdallarchaeota archaeon]
MRKEIVEFIIDKKFRFMFFGGLFLLMVEGFIRLINPNLNNLVLLIQITVGLLIFVLIWAFWDFFNSDRRMSHSFNIIHGSNALSGFYRIYFPIIILFIAIQFLTVFALLPKDDGGWGVLDPDISPSFWLALGILPTLVLGLGIIVLADMEMRKKKILLAPKRKQMSYARSLIYLPPLLGVYFGFLFISRFLIDQIFGPRALIQVGQNSFRIDQGLVSSARFWIFLTERERILVLVAFILIYVALEYLLRGLIANEARIHGLGAGGIVFVPAIVQAFAFSSGNLVFSEPVLYVYTILSALLLGIIIGIVLWRTGRFITTVTIAILARFFDHTLEFQVVVLNLLPEGFGDYDPVDNLVTTADQIGSFLLIFEIMMVFFAPFFIFSNYKETWNIVSRLWKSLKNQWFGYFVLAFAFFIIDLIFSYFAGINPFFPFFGFILAILAIGFVINYLFKVLPTPLEMTGVMSDYQYSEYPVDVLLDIQYVERSEKWFDKPVNNGLIGGFVFIYFLFVSAAYRNYTVLSVIEQIKYSIFLVLMPTIIFGLASFLITRAHRHGYFFSESWRKSIMSVLLVAYLVNLYIWSISASLASFAWRNIPFFVIYVILLTSKPLRTPLKDFTIGFQGPGRYATYRYIDNNASQFILEFENLENNDSDAVKIGTKVMGAKLNLINESSEILNLKENNNSKGSIIGSILAIGINGTGKAESVLLSYLDNEVDDIKLCAYWALGKVGSSQVLGRMAQILESNPKKNLIPVAEKAILTIDPNYPLAGMRENVLID